MQSAAAEPLLNRTRLRLRFPSVIGHTEANPQTSFWEVLAGFSATVLTAVRAGLHSGHSGGQHSWHYWLMNSSRRMISAMAAKTSAAALAKIPIDIQ